MSIFFGPEYDEGGGKIESRYWKGYGPGGLFAYVRSPDAETASRVLLHYFTADKDDDGGLQSLDYYLQGIGIDHYPISEVSKSSFQHAKIKLWEGSFPMSGWRK